MLDRSKLCVTHSQLVVISISLLFHFQNGSCGYQEEWKPNFYPETTSGQYTNTEYRTALQAKLGPSVLFNTEPTVEEELKSLGGFVAGTPPQREPPLETSEEEIFVVSDSPFGNWTFREPADIIKSLDTKIELKQKEFLAKCGDRKPVQTALYCGFLFTGQPETTLIVNKFVFVISSIVDNGVVHDTEPVAASTSTGDVSADKPVDGVGDGAEGDGNDKDTSATVKKERTPNQKAYNILGTNPDEMKKMDEKRAKKAGKLKGKSTQSGAKATPQPVRRNNSGRWSIRNVKRKLEQVMGTGPGYRVC